MSGFSRTRMYNPSPSDLTEDPEEYQPGGLHPILIGDTLNQQRYRIVHKLGFGTYSTVWLAHDQQLGRYVAIKIARAGTSAQTKELEILQRLTMSNSEHPGRDFIIKLLGFFMIEGPNGNHLCVVTDIAGQQISLKERLYVSDLRESQLAAFQLAQGLAFLHNLGIAHGDLYPSNILTQIQSFDNWSDEDIYDCLGHPVIEEVRKITPGPIESRIPKYTVRPGNLAALETKMAIKKVVIVDFGQAFYHHQRIVDLRTPAQFSAPERLFGGALTAAVDKWSFACTVFQLCSGYSLFKMLFHRWNDVRKDVVAMLGKPPDHQWNNWEERSRYFEQDGTPKNVTGRMIPIQVYSLRQRVFNLASCRGIPSPVLYEEELVNMLDLLENLLVYEPDSRISFDDVMKHVFFVKSLASTSE